MTLQLSSFGDMPLQYTGAFLAQPTTTQAQPAHRHYCTGMDIDLAAQEKKSWPEPGPKCCF
jgi:hypothetical protein